MSGYAGCHSEFSVLSVVKYCHKMPRKKEVLMVIIVLFSQQCMWSLPRLAGSWT